MTGWMIPGAVLLLLVLLGQLRVGVRGGYSGGAAALWVRLGWARLRLWPRRQKPPGAKKKRKKRPPEPRRADKPPAGEKKRTIPSAGEGLAYAQALLPVVLEAAGQFRRKLRVDTLRLELRTGGDDPAQAAVNFGRANAALGALWLPLTECFQVADGSARVTPGLEGEGTDLSAQASLSLKLWQVLWLGLYFGLKSLRAVLGARRTNQTRRKAV